MAKIRNLYIYDSSFLNTPDRFLASIIQVYEILGAVGNIYVSRYWELMYENREEWEELQKEMEVLSKINSSAANNLVLSVPNFKQYKPDTIYTPKMHKKAHHSGEKSALVLLEGHTLQLDTRIKAKKYTKSSHLKPVVYKYFENKAYDLDYSLVPEAPINWEGDT